MRDMFEPDTPDAEEVFYDILTGYKNEGLGFEPKPLLNANNIWLVKSAYQKAIRRGNTELALKMASHLFAADPDAAFRSLSTTIVEDIGPTVPGLLAASCVITLKTVTRNFDPPALFAGMTKAASMAPQKTRGCCELALGFEAKHDYPQKFESVGTDMEHMGFLFDGAHISPGKTVIEIAEDAYWSACVLRQRCKHGNTELMNAILTAIIEETKDSDFALDHTHSFERNVDRMNLAALPVHQILAHDFDQLVLADDKAPEPIIIRAGIPDYAYDMHTMQGKKAIKGFYNRLKDEHEVLQMLEPEKAVGVLGAVLFVIDGGIINNRLISSNMLQLKTYQDRNFIVSRGAEETRWEELVELMRENWATMQELRAWAAGV